MSVGCFVFRLISENNVNGGVIFKISIEGIVCCLIISSYNIKENTFKTIIMVTLTCILSLLLCCGLSKIGIIPIFECLWYVLLSGENSQEGNIVHEISVNESLPNILDTLMKCLGFSV